MLAVLLAACKQPTEKINSELPNKSVKDSLTMKMDSIYNHGSIIGFSVAVVGLDGIHYNEGFGFGNIANKVSYSPQTLQNIGSVSKTFIGISLLKAQELGMLKLDHPVNNYLPFKVVNKNHPETSITIRQLATHTSSILDSDYYGLSYVLIDTVQTPNERVLDYFNSAETKTTMEIYLEKVVGERGKWRANSFAEYAPGATYEYSNIAATLAALVLEKATGTPFPEFTKKHILIPLQMNASGWSDSDIDRTKRARSYINKDTIIARYELITYPDGGFISSTEDLSSYLIELMKGKAGKGTLLSPDSYQELFTKQLTDAQLAEDAQEGNSGIFMDFSTRGLGHNGGDPGIVTFMYFNEDTNIGKIVFQNTEFDENPPAVKTFKAIWETLGSFENKL